MAVFAGGNHEMVRRLSIFVGVLGGWPLLDVSEGRVLG
jgi:hypothetical protein